MTAVAAHDSFLSTRRGVYTLLLLCAVQFMDIIDSSIMNVALPSIRADLGFTQQGFGRALLAGSIALLVATVIALRATNTRSHTPQPDPGSLTQHPREAV
jgi:hypothetical protein